MIILLKVHCGIKKADSVLSILRDNYFMPYPLRDNSDASWSYVVDLQGTASVQTILHALYCIKIIMTML